MQACLFCGAKFANQDTYQIHLGVGAPIFHTCNDAEAMTAKGMVVDTSGVWSLDTSLVVHWQGWASLKSSWAPGSTPKE